MAQEKKRIRDPKLQFRCDLNFWDLDGASKTVRHCSQCDKHVFNLTAMSRRKAKKFLAEHPEACIRFVSRDGYIVHDGDVLDQLFSQRAGAKKLLATALIVHGAFAAISDDYHLDPFATVRDALVGEPQPVQEKFSMGQQAPHPDIIY